MSQAQIDQIRQAVAEMTSYVRSTGIQNFSDEAKLEFANFLSRSADRISELRQAIPPITPNIPEGSELLWQLAGGQPDAFVNYLRTVPDPALNSLLRQPDVLNNLINHFTRTAPPGEPPSSDGIQHADLNSSNIYGFKYNPKNQRLMVKFQEGPVYGYDGVPPGVFDIFRQGAVPAKTDGKNRFGRWWKKKQPSLGAAFYEMIRQGGYPYQRLS